VKADLCFPVGVHGIKLLYFLFVGEVEKKSKPFFAMTPVEQQKE